MRGNGLSHSWAQVCLPAVGTQLVQLTLCSAQRLALLAVKPTLLSLVTSIQSIRPAGCFLDKGKGGCRPSYSGNGLDVMPRDGWHHLTTTTLAWGRLYQLILKRGGGSCSRACAQASPSTSTSIGCETQAACMAAWTECE